MSLKSGKGKVVYMGINKRWKTEIRSQTRKNSKGFFILVKTKMLYFGFRKDQVINSPTSHLNEPLHKLFCFFFSRQKKHMTPFLSLKHQFLCQSCFPRIYLILVYYFKSIAQKDSNDRNVIKWHLGTYLVIELDLYSSCGVGFQNEK